MKIAGGILRPISYIAFGIALGRTGLEFTDSMAWILLGCMIANSIGTMMEFYD